MENFFLSAIVRELASEVLGRNVAKISLSSADLMIDLRLPNGRALLASLDRTSPALFISDANLRASGSDSGASHPFASLLRKHLPGSQIVGLNKQPLDRVVRIEFERFDAGGDLVRNSLVLALTGRSSNAYINDASGHTLAALMDGYSLPLDEEPDDSKEGSSLKEILANLDESATLAETLEKLFGQSSVFSPQLKSEFIARSQHASPKAAFGSLVHDLIEKEPQPYVYLHLPLE